MAHPPSTAGVCGAGRRVGGAPGSGSPRAGSAKFRCTPTPRSPPRFGAPLLDTGPGTPGGGVMPSDGSIKMRRGMRDLRAGSWSFLQLRSTVSRPSFIRLGDWPPRAPTEAIAELRGRWRSIREISAARPRTPGSRCTTNLAYRKRKPPPYLAGEPFADRPPPPPQLHPRCPKKAMRRRSVRRSAGLGTVSDHSLGFCGLAVGEGVGGDVAGDEGAGTDHAVFADRYAAQDGYV